MINLMTDETELFAYHQDNGLFTRWREETVFTATDRAVA